MTPPSAVKEPHHAAGARRWRMAVWGTAALLLLLPVLAQLSSDEMRWGPGDFLAFAALLATAGAVCELAVRTGRGGAYRAAVAVAVAGAFLMVWVHAAVGLIGDGSHPANLLFLAVLGVGAAGTVVVRGRPLGMARSLQAMALAQGLLALVAGLAGWPLPLAASLLFILTWLLSAWLFSRAAAGTTRIAVP